MSAHISIYIYIYIDICGSVHLIIFSGSAEKNGEPAGRQVGLASGSPAGQREGCWLAGCLPLWTGATIAHRRMGQPAGAGRRPPAPEAARWAAHSVIFFLPGFARVCDFFPSGVFVFLQYCCSKNYPRRAGKKYGLPPLSPPSSDPASHNPCGRLAGRPTREPAGHRLAIQCYPAARQDRQPAHISKPRPGPWAGQLQAASQPGSGSVFFLPG